MVFCTCLLFIHSQEYKFTSNTSTAALTLYLWYNYCCLWNQHRGHANTTIRLHRRLENGTVNRRLKWFSSIQNKWTLRVTHTRRWRREILKVMRHVFSCNVVYNHSTRPVTCVYKTLFDPLYVYLYWYRQLIADSCSRESSPFVRLKTPRAQDSKNYFRTATAHILILNERPMAYTSYRGKLLVVVLDSSRASVFHGFPVCLYVRIKNKR